MSKKMNVGRVAMCAKGEWSSGVAYGSLDLVTYNDALWIAKCDNTAEAPYEGSTYWDKVLDTVISAVLSGGGESEETPSQSAAPLAFLPKEIFVAKGRTIEIYNKNICPDYDKYHFKWTCDIGKCYERKFSVNSSTLSASDHPLTLELLDTNGKVVATLNSKICIRVMDTDVTSSICPIGGGHVDNRGWLYEVKNILSSQRVEYVGMRYSEGYNSYHEGRHGWTTDTYLTQESCELDSTGSTVTNPFWSGGFSWIHYVNNLGNVPSAVQLFFGDKELANADNETFLANIKSIIDVINVDVRENNMPTIPIFVVLPPLCAPQDGFATDQTGQLTGKCKYELDIKFVSAAKMLYEFFDTDEYSNVFFVPVMQCHDTDNNFPKTNADINPRSSDFVFIPDGAVYPFDQGYLQMADVMFSAYMQVYSA